MPPPAKRTAAKPTRMAAGASAGEGGAADRARRVRAPRCATRTTWPALLRARPQPRKSPQMRAKPTRTNPMTSPALSAPINRQAANGAPVVADVGADAVGAAGRTMVLRDRSPTSWGRRRLLKQPARWLISTDIHHQR